MATYNWSLRPNVPNRYNLVIEDTPDNVRPNNAVYIALWGNDITGNGSRMYPYRTFEFARFISATIIVGSGVYREIARIGGQGFADGDVVIDNTINGEDLTVRPNGFILKTKDAVNLYESGFCTLFSARNIYLNAPNSIHHNVISCRGSIFGDATNIMSVTSSGNNTFISSKINPGGSTPENPTTYMSCFYFSIFDGCDFTLQYYGATELPPIWDYCLFHNCRFRMLQSDDYVEINNKVDLLAFIKTVHPNYIGLTNCVFGDPQFNNPNVGDYSLSFNSPAKNASYFGTYVGALSLGYPILARADETQGTFRFSSAVNVTIGDNEIKLNNKNLDASIETKVIPNLIQRELAVAPIYGFIADRNGHYIDSIADLATTVVTASEALKPNTPYIVEGSAITYVNAVIQPGERFTTTDVTSYTTELAGVCREITEAPQRHTIEARFSDGEATILEGSPLTPTYWYYVTGTINYNGIDYTDKTFEAIDSNAFIGAGTVIEAMKDQAYQHYEPNVKFKSNNIGDTRLGKIIRGNGDPDYERGTGKEFPISAKFMQVKYTIRVNNLKP
ncbi:hypothetical protein ACTJKC_15015 [Pedobacter sp. 22226]|uniref:hypothetical protein n=1 Tax=Pedobacter sp. 22226 TaxID=3453894 RepID=UPI003F833750